MRILVVIPHYGPDTHLARLLPSLGAALPPGPLPPTLVVPFAHGEIYVVNNNLGNTGFTRACNKGLAYALRHHFDAAWLLNNDTEVPSLGAALQALAAEFAAHPQTGVVGMQMRAMHDPDFIHHGGTVGEPYPAGVHKNGRVSQGDCAVRTEELWVTGASLVITAQCLRTTGLLDEQFFNYASDAEYCYRARAHGFGVVYLPIPILHAIGQSQHPSPTQLEVLKKDMSRLKYIELLTMD